jgi:hypothetical protein
VSSIIAFSLAVWNILTWCSSDLFKLPRSPRMSCEHSFSCLETRPCVLGCCLWEYFQKCITDQIHSIALYLHLDAQGQHRGNHCCEASSPWVSIGKNLVD